MKSIAHTFAAALAASALLAQPALAAGEGGGADEATQCNSGHVWDKGEKKCVPEKSSSVDDGDLLDSAIAYAYAERYGDAIRALKLISDDNNPTVLNYLGYATRKSGDLAGGLAYYRKAIAADPDYTLARAYMGEAYLTAGDRPAAMAQLREIERREGSGGEAYAYLAEALDGQGRY
jgi:predicted Zn-dependent protease